MNDDAHALAKILWKVLECVDMDILLSLTTSNNNLMKAC